MSIATAEVDPDRVRLLDAAEQLFYAKGIQVVGMDELRGAAGLPLKRIYQLYPSKDDLIVAFLRRRHDQMMASIAERIGQAKSVRGRVLAIFDWLRDWFVQPDFRGCPWMNANGELGPTNAGVAVEVHRHQREFRRLLTGVAVEAGCAGDVSNAVYLLAEGAVVAASTQHSATPAAQARRAVELLLDGAGLTDRVQAKAGSSSGPSERRRHAVTTG